MSQNPTPPKPAQADPPLTHSTPSAPVPTPPSGQVNGYHEGDRWAGNVRYVCEGMRNGRPCGYDELNESRMIDHVLAEHPQIA
jgi:hypothetical protein